MDIKEVKEFLQSGTTEVKELINSFITKERVSEYLETEDGKRLVQPKLDAYVTKSIETWKSNNLEKVLNDEITKRYPAETDEQKKLKELSSKLEQMEKEKTREYLKNRAITKATEKGLPINLVDHFIGADESETYSNLDLLEQTFAKAINDRVEGTFKGAGRTIDKKEEKRYEDNPFTQQYYNLTSQAKVIKENQTEAIRLIKQAGKDPAKYGL